MYHFMQAIGLILLFIIMILFPSETVQSAANGLLLWYNSVLPTLFPYMILSSLMIQTNTTSLIAKVFGPVIRHIFHISSHGVFAVVGGMLCGYPMGAKIAAELAEARKISPEEGAYLVSFCNNLSPMFMLNFAFMNHLKCTSYIIPGMCIYLLSPVLCSSLFYTLFYKRQMCSPLNSKFTEPRLNSGFFQNLDNAIMKSIESIVKIGGYIILFSILIQLFDVIIPADGFYKSFLLSLLEISNGIEILSKLPIPLEFRWLSILFISSFGGICSIAQTSCMLKSTKISIKTYTIEKLITACVTSLLAILYLAVIRIS